MYRFTSPAAPRHPWETERRRLNRGSGNVSYQGKDFGHADAACFSPAADLRAWGKQRCEYSHYDLLRPDFVGMAREGIAGVIHEAT